MNMILAVAKAGVNVLTATNPNDFIFHSDYNTFKILAEGTASPSLAVTAGDSHAIAHNQSISPFVYGFCKYTGGRVSPPGTKDPSVDFWFARLEVDATNIYFHYVNATG